MPPKQAPDKFQYRDEREKSFTDGIKVPTTRIIKVWEHEIPSITSLVDNGFYYTPTRKNQDQVTCFWCGKKANDIVGVQALGCHHLRTSPKCAYGLIQSNMEYCVSARDKEEFWRTLAEEERAPRSVTDPHSSESVMLRASTFKDLWKLDGQKKCTATSRDLAKAGLYYSPLDKDNDRVICMYCDCPLDHWDPEDDPLREHRANSYAYCYFLDTLPGGKQNGTSSDNRNGAQKRKSKVPLPDDSLDDIDDSIMSTTPVPSPRVKSADKEHDSSVSSPLNEPVSKWPSPLPSTEPELHKDSEFDAYDFSIEDIEDPDHGSIFDDGKSKVYHRKPRLRKPPPPPPESIAKKRSSKGSFMLEVDKSRESDESTNRSMTLTHTNGEHKQSLQTSEGPLITEKLQRPSAAEDTLEDDGASDKDTDAKINLESTGQSEISLIESDDLTPSLDDGSKFTISENDPSYEDHGSAVDEEQALKKTANHTPKAESGNTKKRLLESLDGSMDSDRFKQILASPGKKKKVKLNQAEGAYKPKDDILDLSGHNIGDFNESNISYLEEQRQLSKVRNDEFATKKRPVLSTELSTKVKKSAFDDDDDDFDFFVHRSNKLKGVQKSDHNEEPANEKPRSSLDKNSLLDISASTDVEMAQQSTPKEAALNLNEARKAPDSHLNENNNEGSVDKDMQNAINDHIDGAGHADEQSFNEEHIPSGLRKGGQQSTEEEKDGPSNHGQSSEPQTDQTLSKEEKHSFDNNAFSNPEGGQTSPTDHASAGEKAYSRYASPRVPNLEPDAKVSNLDAPAAPASVAESKETTMEEYVDTRAEFDDSKAETPTRFKTGNLNGAPSDEENDSGGESNFTLSPSTYGDYVKDMRSMEDEFVDSSVMQESKSGGLMIEKSSKSNILENVDEDPMNIDEQGGMVLFDEHSLKNEPERAIVLEKAPSRDKTSPNVGEKMSHHVQRIPEAEEQVNDIHGGKSEIEGALETKDADNSGNETSIGDVSIKDAKPTSLEASERDNLAVATKEEKELDELDHHAHHASETVHDEHNGEEDGAVQVSANIPVLRMSEGAIDSVSSPSYNESPHNRTFIEESLPASVDERDDGSIEQQRQEDVPSPSTKQLDKISGSFIESSTPRKAREDAVYKYYPRIDTSKLGNIMDELKTLTDTMDYLAEVSAASCELHNDNEGILTDFIAAMPEEEEAMTVKEWMQHNAATCGRTVRAIADRMIDAYAAEFDNLIEYVAGLPTTD